MLDFGTFNIYTTSAQPYSKAHFSTLAGVFTCITRVEFSKPNIEISITVTNASKLRSFGRLYSHNFPHHSHFFLQQ